jgi:hypothetical protein
MNDSRLRETIADLSGKAWFPQAPLALAVALLGLLHLIPVIDQAVGLHLHLRTPGSVRQDLVGIDLPGISQLSIGVFLLIIVLTGLLLASYRHFDRSSLQFGTLAALVALVVVFGYAVFRHQGHHGPSAGTIRP